MAEPKIYLHYAGEKLFVTQQIVGRITDAIADAGSSAVWIDLYGHGGAAGDQDLTILVGPGIPMLITSEPPA